MKPTTESTMDDDERCKQFVANMERKLDSVLDSQARVEAKVNSLTDYLKTKQAVGGQQIGERT